MTNTARRIAADIIPHTIPGYQGLRDIAVLAIERYRQEEDPTHHAQVFLSTSDPELMRINSAADLEAFRSLRHLRNDWHEPDEQGITAYVIGNHLDNAMGPTVEHGHGELNVVIATETDVEGAGTSFEKATFRPVAVVNLASLLSWATDGAKSYAALIEQS